MRDEMVWVEFLFRWMHVLFGVIWIGILYFFNFIQGGFEAKLDAATKKITIPELRPRALYWFRWGAAWTYLTGIGLLGLTYYMGLKGTWYTDPNGKGMAYAMVIVGLLVLPMVYDVVAKAFGAWDKKTIVAGCALIVVGGALMLYVGKFGGRALFVHVGAMFGTAMAMNVWMRIWPAQKKIITAIKNGEKPDDALVKLAGGRSRTNTYLSVPLLLLMLSNNHTVSYSGTTDTEVFVKFVILTALGFVVANLLFRKAAKVVGM